MQDAYNAQLVATEQQREAHDDRILHDADNVAASALTWLAVPDDGVASVTNQPAESPQQLDATTPSSRG